MAESFGVKMGVEGEKEFKNALKEINSAFKVLGSEMNLVTSQFDKNDKSIQSLSARNGVLTKEIEAQKNKVQTLQAALENASSSFGEADSRTRSWQIQLNNAQADLNKMESELKANEDAIDRLGQEMEEAEEQTDDFAESLSDSGDMAEDSSGKFEKVGSVVAGVGTAIAAAAAAIGAAVVVASVELIKLGDEYNKAVNQISASTGATGTELEELGVIAQKVYTNNFGDSLEDVAEGLSVVQKTTGLVGDELQKATESGFALRDTFGYDLQESARAANALMKNFGVTAEEAYNIIAVGAQNGADQNGDLLDTLNEYSAQYSALGLSADQFVTGLINGAEAGVFSIDKVGDAVKEFNLRAKDGSNTTIEAFQALGMNADEMTKRFAAGGESAEEAFFEVVNALNNMDDPIAKNTAAVNLFGTQFEDLQANVLPVLAGMKDGAAASYDALSQINEIKYADLDSALEGTKRSIEGVFLPTVSQMSAGITDVFSTLGNAINEANGDFSQISVAIGTAIGDVAAIITEQMPMFLELGLNIVTSIGGAILENLPILIESATNIVLTIEYSERIIPVECSVFPEQDFSALVHRIDEINGWLNPYRGVQPLIFDEYPDRYFMARLNTEISMERVSRAAGTFSLEFICPNPFGYAVEDEVFSIAAEGKTTVNRQKGNLISEPIFELKAVMDSTSSYVDIEVNGELVRVKGKLAEGETFVLDTAKLTAKVVDSNTRETLRNGLSQLDELVFPELNPGGNEVLVSVSGAAFTELTIQGRSRWV